MTFNPHDDHEWARLKLRAMLRLLIGCTAAELQVEALTLIAAANRCRHEARRRG